ncbi:MAG: PEP-CTERM sorting domain-containing protein [Deltaproteobacteria bacterium]|nr:PEP-CTERM sorting domain-containing protein [Deltaproteobacteria bacterium]
MTAATWRSICASCIVAPPDCPSLELSEPGTGLLLGLGLAGFSDHRFAARP